MDDPTQTTSPATPDGAATQPTAGHARSPEPGGAPTRNRGADVSAGSSPAGPATEAHSAHPPSGAPGGQPTGLSTASGAGGGERSASANGTPGEPHASAEDSPGFGERGRLRRRARFLRKARELAYRDLGGLVFDLHRFGARNDALVLAKLETIGRIDGELRAIETTLAEHRPVTVLREAGVAACPRCAAIHGSEDRFCPNCGLAMDLRAERPVAAPQSATTAPAPAPFTASAPSPPPAPTPAPAPFTAPAPSPPPAPTPARAPFRAPAPSPARPSAAPAPATAPAPGVGEPSTPPAVPGEPAPTPPGPGGAPERVEQPTEIIRPPTREE